MTTLFFSTTKPVIALNRFAVSLDKKWADFLDKDEWELIINDQDINLKGTEFFFCKDIKMFSLHDEKGYSTDSQGEGCFYLIVKFMESFVVKATIEQEIKNSIGDFNRDPYSSIIVLEDVYEYTIVTPVSPEIDEFSAFFNGNLDRIVIREKISCYAPDLGFRVYADYKPRKDLQSMRFVLNHLMDGLKALDIFNNKKAVSPKEAKGSRKNPDSQTQRSEGGKIMTTLNEGFMHSSETQARKGMNAMTKTTLLPGVCIYRFANTERPDRIITGAWWVGLSPFEAIKKYCKFREQPLVLAAQQCLAISPERNNDNDSDLLIKTKIKQKLSAWAGTPKTQIDKKGGRLEPDRDVTQLYIPGLGEADPNDPNRKIWQSAFTGPWRLYLE